MIRSTVDFGLPMAGNSRPVAWKLSGSIECLQSTCSISNRKRHTVVKHSLLLLTFSCASLLAEDNFDLAQYVNPFIGTGEGAPDNGIKNAAGNTPPGAATPFGM